MDMKRREHDFTMYEYIYLNNTLKIYLLWFLDALVIKKSIFKDMVKDLTIFFCLSNLHLES